MAPHQPGPPSLVSFDSSLQVGVAEVDEQHRSLIHGLNRLIADSHAAPNSDLFSEVLSHLGHEFADHFTFEEKLLQRLAMPQDEIDAHVAAHRQILSQYTDLNFSLMRSQPLARGTVLESIQRWVVEHIFLYDLQIRRYLPAPG